MWSALNERGELNQQAKNPDEIEFAIAMRPITAAAPEFRAEVA
jgi:hypothetical protein